MRANSSTDDIHISTRTSVRLERQCKVTRAGRGDFTDIAQEPARLAGCDFAKEFEAGRLQALLPRGWLAVIDRNMTNMGARCQVKVNGLDAGD